MWCTDYRERLGIGFSDKEKAEQLSNKLLNYLCYGSYMEEYDEVDFVNYCIEIGMACDDPTEYISYFRWLFGKGKLTVSESIFHYVVFVNTQKCSKKHKNEWFNLLKKALNDLSIPFEIIKDADGIFFFPKGAKELDDALVSQPLEWLSAYPNARKAWIIALKGYSEATDETASQAADNFRKALEAFFKEYFQTDKSLENLKSEYGQKLKDYGVPPEVSNNFCTLLQSYTDYINKYAKHNDKTSKLVLEYIMYQTGNIMRLLITLG